VTWWVLVGDNKNNLLAVKKISVKKKLQLKVQIDLPEDLHSNSVSVYLMADSYVGLDQVQKVAFKIKD
jgi:pre-mRNA-splicing helicase BRR2